MSERPTIVSAVGLTKIFRDFWGRPRAKAVNDIDFEIKEGEVVGLLGPNGSGKSTTVKLLLGLLYPTAGRLTVLGKSPRSVDSKKEIGYLPEESYLYKYLTAEETLDYFGSLFNLPRAERKNRIVQLLEMVGLVHARERRIGEFSKGMARRIGLAQAMINDPAFLILDEPTSGLDPLGCKEVKDLILNLKKRGKTVLVTSHLLSDVQDVCDRVIILYGGKIRSEGDLDELLSVSDQTEIVSPGISDEAAKEIAEILRRDIAGKGEFVIANPKRSLEDFFLDVVNRARRDSVETSGAAKGGEIAPYLSGEQKTEAILEELAHTSSPAQPEPKQETESDGEPQRSADENIATLLKGFENTVPEEGEKLPAAAEAAKDSTDLSEADRKLSELLGKHE